MPTMLNILKICNMVHYGLYFTSFPNLVQPSKYVKISIFGKVSKFAKIQRNTQIIEHFWKAVYISGLPKYAHARFLLPFFYNLILHTKFEIPKGGSPSLAHGLSPN